ncbi:hypothetical protein AOLI_G00161880 [Acnodon oligacanthus]
MPSPADEEGSAQLWPHLDRSALFNQLAWTLSAIGLDEVEPMDIGTKFEDEEPMEVDQKDDEENKKIKLDFLTIF